MYNIFYTERFFPEQVLITEIIEECMKKSIHTKKIISQAKVLESRYRLYFNLSSYNDLTTAIAMHVNKTIKERFIFFMDFLYGKNKDKFLKQGRHKLYIERIIYGFLKFKKRELSTLLWKFSIEEEKFGKL